MTVRTRRQLTLAATFFAEWSPFALIFLAMFYGDLFFANSVCRLAARLFLNGLLLWALYRAVSKRRFILAALTIAVGVAYDVLVPRLIHGEFLPPQYSWVRSWNAFSLAVFSLFLFIRFFLMRGESEVSAIAG